MFNERAIVESLNRQELLGLVAHFEVPVSDRRVRDQLVDALCSSRKVRLEAMLSLLPLSTLKDLCDVHGLETGGRGKATFLERLVKAAASKGKKAPAKKAAKAAAPSAAKPARGKKAAKAAAPAPAKSGRGKKAAAEAASTKPTRGAKAAAKPVRGKKAAAEAPPTKPTRGTKAAAEAATAKPARAKKLLSLNPAAEPAAVEPPAPQAVEAAAAPVAKAPRKPRAKKPEVVVEAAPPPKAQAPRINKKPVAPAPETGAPAPADSRVPAASVTAHAAFKTPNGTPTQAHPATGPAPQPTLQTVSPSFRPQVPQAPKPAAAPPKPAASQPRGNPLDNVIALPTTAKPQVYRQPLPIEPTLFQPTTAVKKCQHCKANIELRKCGVQRCHTMIKANPSRKICAECLFERNTLSMTEFNERLVEESKCPHCGEAWQRAS